MDFEKPNEQNSCISCMITYCSENFHKIYFWALLCVASNWKLKTCLASASKTHALKLVVESHITGVSLGCALYKSWAILHFQGLFWVELRPFVFLLDIRAKFAPGLLGWQRLVPASFRRWVGVLSSPTSAHCWGALGLCTLYNRNFLQLLAQIR